MAVVSVSDSQTSRLQSGFDDLSIRIVKALDDAPAKSIGVPGLTLYRNTAPTGPNACTYEPSLLVIPQGRKRVDLAKQSFVFGQENFLLTSIELPVVSQVIRASEKTPSLAFFLKLDMQIVRDLLHSEDVRVPPPPLGTRGGGAG